MGRDRGRAARAAAAGAAGLLPAAIWLAWNGTCCIRPNRCRSCAPIRRPDEAGPLEAWRRYHIARLLDQIPGVPAPPGRVAIEAYQRVPLLRALDMVRPRLLLADGVGLGKTIQAGLIAAELLVRRRAHRILIVCPPGPLLRQWEQEMRVRFGLRFTVDRRQRRACGSARRGLELGGNPFDATALCLTSMDFAKSDRVLAELERVSWDLVIIDEAHHCVGDENQRRRLAEVLACQVRWAAAADGDAARWT